MHLCVLYSLPVTLYAVFLAIPTHSDSEFESNANWTFLHALHIVI